MCFAITGDTSYNANLTSLCGTPIKVGYLLRSDTGDIYNATQMFIGFDCSTFADTGYYKEYANPDWRYWDKTGATFSSSGTCSGVTTTTTTTIPFTGTTTTTTTLPPAVPGIVLEPSPEDIMFCRSPVVYRFSGLTTGFNNTFNLYIGIDTGFTLYYSEYKKCDTISGLTVDVSNLLANYIRTYVLDDIPNGNRVIIYFYATLNTNSSTITTSTSQSTMGYTDYPNISKLNASIPFNLTGSNIIGNGQQNNSLDLGYSEYLLNSIPLNTPYYIPNYYNNFSDATDVTHINSLKWRYNNISTGYNITYTTTGGTQTTFLTNFITGYTQAALNEIRDVEFGYNELIFLYNKVDVDINKPIYLTFMNCLSAITYFYLSPFNPGFPATIIYYPLTCNGNELTNVNFLNRYGVWDIFYFKGKSSSELNYTNEVYKYNRIDYQNMIYEPGLGSYHKTNIQGKNSLTIDTGWLDEFENVRFQELLLSEYIIINVQAYIITDKQVKYKTTKWDKLINYTLTFESAFDTINNII